VCELEVKRNHSSLGCGCVAGGYLYDVPGGYLGIYTVAPVAVYMAARESCGHGCCDTVASALLQRMRDGGAEQEPEVESRAAA
jgi:hypothetical protein